MQAAKVPFTKCNRESVIQRFGPISWFDVGVELDRIPNGEKGYMSIHKEGKPKSLQQLAYYYAVILPTAFKAFRDSGNFTLTLSFKDKDTVVDLTEATVDIFLKIRYAQRLGEYKDKADMTMAECSAFEDWSIQWLATWLNCQIPPSDINWRDKQVT